MTKSGSHRASGIGKGTALLAASLAVLGIAIALRVGGPSDLWDHTQPRTISYTTDILVHGRWLLPVQDGVFPATKPPLYNWLATPAVAMSGYASELAHKMPSLLAWITSWVIVLMIGVALTRTDTTSRRDWTIGAVAGIVFVANHLVYKLGYLARPDMVLSVVMLAGWWCATSELAATDRNGRASWRRLRVWGFWTCVGLAGLIKGAAAIPLVAYAFVAPLFVARRVTAFGRLGWWWGLPWCACIVGAWFGAAYRVDPDHVRDTLWYAEVYGRVTGLGPEGSTEGPAALIRGAPNMAWYYLQRFLPWSVLSFSAAIHLARRVPATAGEGGSDRSPRRVIALGTTGAHLVGAALFVLVLIGLYTLSAGKRADYLLPAIGPAALLIAWWFVDVTARRPAWRWSVVPVAMATLAMLARIDHEERTGPGPGFGDSILAFVHDARPHLDADGEPLRFCWIWETSLPALLGASGPRYADPGEATADIMPPFWVITGREPRPFAAALAETRPDLRAEMVLERPVVPTAGGETPEHATLYRIERGPPMPRPLPSPVDGD